MARILIIEDDELLRHVLAKSLEMAGHQVDQAANGQEGLDLFRAVTPDLVLTDLVMPVQEGVETIMALRRRAPAIPIIAMSGGVPNSGLYLGIASRFGAKRVLAKPFTPQRLLDAVNETLGDAGNGPKPGSGTGSQNST